MVLYACPDWTTATACRMVGLPKSTLQAATTACTQCSCSTGVQPRSLRPRHTTSIIQLHWLPVNQLQSQVQTLLSYPCHLLHSRSPTYLTEAIHAVSTSRSRSGLLRSCSTSHSLPRLCTRFSERAFSHAGPAHWNALPQDIRTVADQVRFQQLLKSHYYSITFNICRLFSPCFTAHLQHL